MPCSGPKLFEMMPLSQNIKMNTNTSKKLQKLITFNTHRWAWRNKPVKRSFSTLNWSEVIHQYLLAPGNVLTHWKFAFVEPSFTSIKVIYGKTKPIIISRKKIKLWSNVHLLIFWHFSPILVWLQESPKIVMNKKAMIRSWCGQMHTTFAVSLRYFMVPTPLRNITVDEFFGLQSWKARCMAADLEEKSKLQCFSFLLISASPPLYLFLCRNSHKMSDDEHGEDDGAGMSAQRKILN